ncbi:MAG: hypothetical protein QXU18_14075 [Thermoplasmatales archaeon]
MISKSTGITIAVVVLVIFAGVAYFTIEKTSASVSISEKGYMNVTLLDINRKAVNSSHESQMALIANSSENITLELKVVTNGTSVYVFDVSPVNNTSETWNNVTEISGFSNASYEMINSNSSLTPVHYYANSKVTDNYIRYNITNPTGTNETVYMNVTLNETERGFSQMNRSNLSNPAEIYPYVVKIIGFSDNGGAGGTGFAVIKI